MKLNTWDGLKSLIGNMGNPERDKAAASAYSYVVIPDNQLIASYATSWVAKKLVDVPAQDMLRKWRTWNGDNVAQIEAEEKNLKLKSKLLECKIKARLYGGAAIFIGTDQDQQKPLDVDKIKSGGVKYLTVMDRRELNPGEKETDPLSELYNKPKYYEVANSKDNNNVKIHPSHFVIMRGHEDIDYQSQVHNGWGASILQAAFDAAKNADSTASNIASLIFEANVDVIGIPDLTTNLSNGGDKFESDLIKRFSLWAKGKGISGTGILDKEEEYNRKSTSFAQLPELLEKFLMIAGATEGIPASRFLGTAPKGLNSTGEGDMKNYYDGIQSRQELELEPDITILDECLIRSATGSRSDESYSWNPLEQMNEKELAEIGKFTTESLKNMSELGVFVGGEVRDIATHKLAESGAFPHIKSIVSETTESLEIGTLVDAMPKTLYVYRPVLNINELKKWAESQGLTLIDDPHVTICYSKSQVDWMQIGEAWEEEIKIPKGGARQIDQFGDATVLLFRSDHIIWRHESFIHHGASHDYSEYQPHITITYQEGVDIESIDPYQGEIVLGNEIFEEIND